MDGLNELTDQQLCNVNTILVNADRITYNNIVEKLETLKELIDMSNAMNRWYCDVDYDNVNMRIGMGRLAVICEMANRFEANHM